VECGRHGEGETRAVAEQLARRFIAAAGLSKEPAVEGETRTFHVISAYRKPAPDFHFVRPLTGLSPLRKGELVGTSSKGEFRPDRDSFAILPNDRVPVGKAAIFLAVAAA